MPSDTFWNEWFLLSPTQFLDAAQRYLLDQFDQETRGEAVQKLIKTAWYTINPEEVEEEPRLLSLPEFLETTPDPPKPIVSDIMPSNKLVLISGRPKDGKSLIIYQILEDINRGGKLMGRFPVERSGPVVYFGMEDGSAEIKDRLLKRGLVEPEDFWICTTPFDIHSPNGWALFMRLLSGLPEPPIVVVIDTVKEAYVTVRDWNDQAIVGPALKPLRLWAQANSTVIVLCHNNKDKQAEGVNKVSGSAALVSSSDVVGVLERVKPREYGVYSWQYELTGRGIRAANYELDMDVDTFEVVCRADRPEDEQEKEVRRAARFHQKELLLQSMTRGVPVTVQQLADTLAISYAYAASIVSELFKEERLDKGAKVRPPTGRHLSQTYLLH